MSARVSTEAARLMDRACDTYAGTPEAGTLDAARARLREPLRVAIAGKVKAGKSTLLNALVGEQLAPTDAGECTRIVTWYRDGITYQVTVHPASGQPVSVPFRREDGALTVRLDGHRPEAIDRMVVEWPSASLRSLVLIDTPGIGSLSTDISERTHAFLAPDDRPGEADAVCYLMRHLHGTDARFLESFHDDRAARGTPMNAVGVLSRADEIGVGRLDALQTAGLIARRYREDPQVRRLCQTVVPVAGLLAQAAVTLRQDEYAALAALAAADRSVTDELLWSADRFGADGPGVEVDSDQRRALLDRMGLFGVRLSLALIRGGGATSATQLAAALVDHSGITALRETLATQFAARADLLKARSALLVLDAVLRRHPGPDSSALAAELERILASTHEFAEARTLNALRAGNVPFGDDVSAEAERLLGGHGDAASARLGLPADSDAATIHAAAVEASVRWRRRAEHPMATRAVADAATVVVRSCEGLLAGQLAAVDGT
ncbi:MAG TPA: dynamin family protein [Jiangellaceae bacterium]